MIEQHAVGSAARVRGEWARGLRWRVMGGDTHQARSCLASISTTRARIQALFYLTHLARQITACLPGRGLRTSIDDSIGLASQTEH